jgi:hypothetical protein
MFKKLLAFTCLALSITLSIGANAAYIVESSPGVVTGIGDLDIGGTSYNVDFEAVGDTFSTFGGNEHFWADISSALTAANAVNAILNAQASLPLLNNNESDPDGYIVWTGAPNPGLDPVISFINGGAYAAFAAGGGYEPSASNSGTAWSVVPIPAAVWLFGSGLIGLVGMARRKKA